MLDESQAQFECGDTISFSMEELRAMESDDWNPTQKVLDFERKHGIKSLVLHPIRNWSMGLHVSCQC